MAPCPHRLHRHVRYKTLLQDGRGENKISLKDIPSYHLPTKEEGKEQYAKFSKDFLGTLKNLRFLLEPGGIERLLERELGCRPAAAVPDRQEWVTRSMAHEN